MSPGPEEAALAVIKASVASARALPRFLRGRDLRQEFQDEVNDTVHELYARMASVEARLDSLELPHHEVSAIQFKEVWTSFVTGVGNAASTDKVDAILNVHASTVDTQLGGFDDNMYWARTISVFPDEFFLVLGFFREFHEIAHRTDIAYGNNGSKDPWVVGNEVQELCWEHSRILMVNEVAQRYADYFKGISPSLRLEARKTATLRGWKLTVRGREVMRRTAPLAQD